MNTPLWLNDILAHPKITDICINGSDEVFVDQGNGLEPASSTWTTEDDLRLWVLDQLSTSGKSWDARHPFIDATLRSGHRMHVSFPPIAQKGILVSLRRSGSSAAPSHQGASRWNQSPLYEQLATIVRRGESVLVAGATGSGKTTLLNDLLGEAPAHERIIALEDTPELAPRHSHFLSLISRPPNAEGCGEVTLRTLMKQTLRMRPDRIILGECRGPEVLELLQALNTGHHGALATLHANSPRDALRRIELLCLLASAGTIPLPVIRELLSVGVQWIAQVRRIESEGGCIRKITELWRIDGREGDTILMRPFMG